MKKKLLELKTWFLKKRIINLIGNQKGSTTIFLMIVIGTIFSVTALMVNLSREKSETGKIDSLLSLSSRSVLSEYHIPLKNNYGIFALNKMPGEISEHLAPYMKKNMPKFTFENLNIATEKQKLSNYDNFEKQITDYTKFLLLNDLFSKNNPKKKERSHEAVLKNKKIISMLVSKGEDQWGLDIGKITDLITDYKSAIDIIKKEVSTNKYIMHMFNNKFNYRKDTFFKNEIEYILCGELKDKKNYSELKNKLRVIRTAINSAVIIADPVLMGQVTTLAGLTSGGTGLTTGILIGGWALLEANNDIKILEHGGKVPYIKNSKNWATTLKNSLTSSDGEYIDTHSKSGFEYEDYLQTMLYTQKREVKLMRMMDLIQLNIQGEYDEEFLINTATTGFTVNCEVNGRDYTYDETY